MKFKCGAAKRRLAAAAVLLLALFWTVRQGQTSLDPSPYTETDMLDGIWLEARCEPAAPGGVDIIFHNETERTDLFHGLGFCIEKERNSRWYRIPVISGSPVSDIDIPIPSASKAEAGFVDGIDYDSDSRNFWQQRPPNELRCDWTHQYGALPPGRYRVVLEVWSKDDSPISYDTPKHFLSAPFSITWTAWLRDRSAHIF